MVYVAEQIATELSSRVEFSVIGPTEFKGVDRAVTIYRATAVDGHGRSGTSRRLSEGGLVGRDTERGIVTARPRPAPCRPGRHDFDRGDCGHRQVPSPQGLRRTGRVARHDGHHRPGEEIEQATAFYAWRPVLRQLFGGDGIEAEG